jgi:hypothetical protein
MTQNEIIEMAKQAGIKRDTAEYYKDELEAFANLVAAKEREACAEPQRTWVGLTDDEMHECAGEFPWTPTGLKCCRAIEAKLKGKNA